MSAWSCACPDWEARIRMGRSLLPDLPLLRSEADRGLAIFNRLRLPDVAGQPTLREAAGDWMRDLVVAIFGAYDPEAKVRHLREYFALVPKKNSKTTGGAAIMVTAMLVNRRPRAEFLIVAPTQEVADLAFRQAVGMVDSDPVLALKFHVQEHLKKITYRPTGAFLKVKSFDTKVVTGSKPTGVLLDELHVIAEHKDADRVIGQLRGGMISQPEAFLLTITTQSERPPMGVFRSELHKARAVRDGQLAAPLCPILYEMPAGTDWKDPANWSMVTPNAGKSITVERLVPDFQAAEQSGEQELRRWATQHLNVEIGLALRSDRWTGAEFWERGADPTLTLDTLLERSEVVCIGIDGGGLDDLFGLCVLGRDKVSRGWLAWSHAWCHEGVLERRKSIAARLQHFKAAGELTIVSDELGDISAIVAIVERVKDAGLLACVGVDPAGLGEFIEALAEIEVTQEAKLLVGVPQGYGMMNAIKTAERKLANGTLRHAGSGLMTWAVSNLKIEPTATAIRATKQNAGDAKIDPVMALFDAVVPMSLNPEPPANANLAGFLADPLFG
ncbi:terminase large subunit [Methylorubrum populi]|nr:terminase TerL endonuclease subunit [Methylorubrum populi]